MAAARPSEERFPFEPLQGAAIPPICGPFNSASLAGASLRDMSDKPSSPQISTSSANAVVDRLERRRGFIDPLARNVLKRAGLIHFGNLNRDFIQEPGDFRVVGALTDFVEQEFDLFVRAKDRFSRRLRFLDDGVQLIRHGADLVLFLIGVPDRRQFMAYGVHVFEKL